MVTNAEAEAHNHGVNPNCEQCSGTGFVTLWDFDGPGLHDENNCDCEENACYCESCQERNARAGVEGCEWCAAQRRRVATAREAPGA